MRRLVLIVLLGASCMAAAPGSGNLENVLNAFLATFAKSNAAWMKEITILRTGAQVSPGMQVGFSPVLGDFGFYPKTWSDLSPQEKAAVHADPRLKSYLVSIRNSEIYPSITNADVGPDMRTPPVPVRIDGGEMLRKRPLHISVQ